MKERNYGIDLLRLVFVYMVCLLHTLGAGGVLNAVSPDSTAYKVFWFLEIFAYCAVDGFALISGYTAVNKTPNYAKLAEMWFQVFFYSFVLSLIISFFDCRDALSLHDYIKLALPITFHKFWYFSAYFALVFAIPVLNKFLFSVNEQVARKTLLLLVFLFSVINLLDDAFQTASGYSAIWLMVLYCIGVMARRIGLFETRSTFSLILIWLFCLLLTWAEQILRHSAYLVSYVSPTVLLSGYIMIVLFSRLHPNKTIVKRLTPLVFGIYLFHTNVLFWTYYLSGSAIPAAEMNIIPGTLLVFGIALILFLCGMLVEWLRQILAKAIRLPILCEKIVRILDHILSMAAEKLK